VSPFCSHCGQSSRDADRFCIRCGAEVKSSSAPSTQSSEHGAERFSRRAGGLRLRRGWLVLALIGIAAVVAVAVLANTGSTPSRRQTADAAPPTARVETRATVTPTATATPTATPKPKRTPPPTPTPVPVRGRGGKMYSCDYAVVRELDVAHEPVERGRRALQPLRRGIDRIERNYPGNTLPSDVYDRYSALIDDFNTQVNEINAAVHVYNRKLEQLCDP
jgi:hypothetical protein